MEGGRIIQCGTPQEIVKEPANQYVADFVQHMNPITIADGEGCDGRPASASRPPIPAFRQRPGPTTPLVDILGRHVASAGQHRCGRQRLRRRDHRCQNIVEGLTRHRNKVDRGAGPPKEIDHERETSVLRETDEEARKLAGCFFVRREAARLPDRAGSDGFSLRQPCTRRHAISTERRSSSCRGCRRIQALTADGALRC